MKIVEEFIKGKNPDQALCEDGIFKSQDFVAVIDGATAKSPILYGGKSSGRAAMEKVTEALADLNPEGDMYEAADFITERMAQWYRQLGLYEHLRDHPVERPTASAVIYNRNRREVWQIGDCAAMADNQYFDNGKKLDEVTSNARSLYIQMLLAQGSTVAELTENDLGRQFIMPLLKNQSALQNNPCGCEYAWEVLDGFPVLKSRMRRIDVSQTKSLILASDGYPKLLPTLQESEAYLQYVLDADPLCYTLNKGTKGLQKGNCSFDDRAYIRLEL